MDGRALCRHGVRGRHTSGRRAGSSALQALPSRSTTHCSAMGAPLGLAHSCGTASARVNHLANAGICRACTCSDLASVMEASWQL